MMTCVHHARAAPLVQRQRRARPADRRLPSVRRARVCRVHRVRAPVHTCNDPTDLCSKPSFFFHVRKLRRSCATIWQTLPFLRKNPKTPPLRNDWERVFYLERSPIASTMGSSTLWGCTFFCFTQLDGNFQVFTFERPSGREQASGSFLSATCADPVAARCTESAERSVKAQRCCRGLSLLELGLACGCRLAKLL